MSDISKVTLPSFTLVLTCENPLPPRPSVIQYANRIPTSPRPRTAPRNFMKTIDCRDTDPEARFAYMPQLPVVRRSETFDDDGSETAFEPSRPTTARGVEEKRNDVHGWKVDINKAAHNCFLLLKRLGLNSFAPSQHPPSRSLRAI